MAAQKKISTDPNIMGEKINDYLNNNSPQINANLDNGIINNNMDPWGQAAYGSQTFGEINLGVCRAECNGSFTIQNLTGLSTLNVSDFNNVSVSDNDGSDEYVGSVIFNGTTNDLSANLYGYIRAHCGKIGAHVTPAGSILIGGLSFTLKCTLFGTHDSSSNEFYLTSMYSEDFLSFELGDIDVKIDGLGIFQDFVDSYINWLTNKLVNILLVGGIEVLITNSVNQVMNENLPVSIPLNSASKPNLEIKKKEGPKDIF